MPRVGLHRTQVERRHVGVCRLSRPPIACSGWDLVAALGPPRPQAPCCCWLGVLGTGRLDRRSPLDGIMLSEIAGKPRVIGHMQGPWSHFRVSQLGARGASLKLGLLPVILLCKAACCGLLCRAVSAVSTTVLEIVRAVICRKSESRGGSGGVLETHTRCEGLCRGDLFAGMDLVEWRCDAMGWAGLG